jgi:hypothetical protein
VLRMHKLALKGVAKVTHINIQTAVRTVRQNPLIESEIHIDEELINLKESLDAYHAAGATLKDYPSIRAHILHERRTIMQHCIGLVVRMLYGKRLPHDYNENDIDYAVRRLVRLVVIDARRAGLRIDRDIMEVFQPFLTVRQRIRMRVLPGRA